MSTKIDLRQQDQTSSLDQLTSSTGVTGNSLFQSVNVEIAPVLAMNATGGTISIGGISATNTVSNRTHAQPHIWNKVSGFTGGTITFPATNAGSISFSTPGSSSVSIASLTPSSFGPVVFYLKHDGTLGGVCGSPGGVFPTSLPACIFAFGYAMVAIGSTGTVNTITDSNLYQFVGGDNSTGVIFDHDLLTNNGGVGSHVAAAAHINQAIGVHGLTVTDTLVGTGATQTLTNKDIDGGVSSITNRITIPQNTYAGLTGLNLPAGAIGFDNVNNVPYCSNGKSLTRMGTSIIEGYLTNNYGEFVLYPSQMLTITDTNPDANILNADSWTAVGTLNQGRVRLAGCGVQNAALSFGGLTTINVGTTEAFSGLSWVNTNLPCATRRNLAGCGIQNAALSIGGYDGVNNFYTVETFNGLGWANTYLLITARRALMGCGTQNAALSAGGFTTAVTNITELFNDLAPWISSGTLNVARQYIAGCGVQNAALSFGGNDVSTPVLNTTENFNGTVWTLSSGLNTARHYLAGCGTQNAALSFGGLLSDGSNVSITESFNGAVWSVKGGLNIPRYGLAGCGAGGYALVFGGFSTMAESISEKFTASNALTTNIYAYQTSTAENSISIKSQGLSIFARDQFLYPVTVAALSVDPNDNIDTDAKRTLGQTGYTVTWTNTTALNTYRSAHTGIGSRGAALAAGHGIAIYGTTGPSFPISSVEIYNGSSWANSTSSSVPTGNASSCGTQNSAVIVGGYSPNGTTPSVLSQYYNGLTWSSFTSLPVSLINGNGCGSYNATYAFNGGAGAGYYYNGLTWASTTDMNAPRTWAGSAGVPSAVLAFGGTTGGVSLGSTELYNGHVWAITTASSLTARSELSGSGCQNAAMSISGSTKQSTASVVTTVERYNGQFWILESAVNAGTNGARNCGTRQNALNFGGVGSNNVVASRSEIALPSDVMYAGRFYYSISP